MNNFKNILESNLNQVKEIPDHIQDTILKLGLDLRDATVTPKTITIWTRSLRKKELEFLVKNKSLVNIGFGVFDTFDIIFKR